MEYQCDWNRSMSYLNTFIIEDIYDVGLEVIASVPSKDKSKKHHEYNLIYYYLVITSDLGMATICQFGPCIKDGNAWSGYNCSLTKMKINQSKVKSLIYAFVNNGKQACEVNIMKSEEALANLPPINKMMIEEKVV